MAQSNYKKSKVALFLVALAALVPSGGAAMEDKQQKNKDPFIQAIIDDNVEAVGKLIEETPEKLNEPTHSYLSFNSSENVPLPPLHCAAFEGKINVAVYLALKGAKVNATTPSNKPTPLFLAAIQGHLHIVTFLLLQGANIDAKSLNNLTPLYVASEKGHLLIVMLLLSRNADVNIADTNNRTALHQAVQEGHLKITEALVKRGAFINAETTSNETPLILALLKGHPEVALFLISEKADITIKNSDFHTPLHLAAAIGYLEITIALVALMEKAEEINAETKNGTTPLFLASQNGHFEIAQFLISKTLKISKKDFVNIEIDPLKRTPLHQAALNGHWKIVIILLQNGARQDERDSCGFTPLELAAMNKKHEVSTLLLFAKLPNNYFIQDWFRENGDCCICKENFIKKRAVVFPCGHIHHKPCIKKNRKSGGLGSRGDKRCPLCKKVVEDDEIFEEEIEKVVEKRDDGENDQ